MHIETEEATPVYTAAESPQTKPLKTRVWFLRYQFWLALESQSVGCLHFLPGWLHLREINFFATELTSRDLEFFHFGVLGCVAQLNCSFTSRRNDSCWEWQVWEILSRKGEKRFQFLCDLLCLTNQSIFIINFETWFWFFFGGDCWNLSVWIEGKETIYRI